MAKLKYVGDDYTQFTEVYGTVFPVGKPTSIDHLPDEHQKTLRGNPMFVAVDDDAPDDDAARVIDTVAGPAAPVPGAPQVPIQPDWDTLPFMALKALAQKVDPTLANDATKDQCVASIEVELGKRAAAAQ